MTIQRSSLREHAQARSKMSAEYRWGWGAQGNIQNEKQHDRSLVGVAKALSHDVLCCITAKTQGSGVPLLNSDSAPYQMCESLSDVCHYTAEVSAPQLVNI